MKDHIIEEAKARDSPIKKAVNKFSPSKSKYMNYPKKFGDSDDEEVGGFTLH